MMKDNIVKIVSCLARKKELEEKGYVVVKRIRARAAVDGCKEARA